ncbi:MAG: phosphatase PAP2 family protein [Lachnospiraceae bacterium]|nr:phosphatase PAP2 family protein [Lachnospiraceae bacterium]
MKKLLKKNKIVWLIPLYAAFYIPWFVWLEKHVTSHYHIIHLPIDDRIPFCEFFIVFYYLWFVYMIGAIAYCVFTDSEAFFRGFLFITTGMTLFLVISTLFPNGHDLRPASFPRDNIFTSLLAFIYKADTPTNIFPSLHVYNAVGAHIALAHNKTLKDKKGILFLSLITCIGIILSTLFLKQHSLFDVAGALVLSLIMYPVCFRSDLRIPLSESQKQVSNNHG